MLFRLLTRTFCKQAELSALIESGFSGKTGKLLPRPPVVTIMGHVDHGKTTLLDALRQSELVNLEHGGITQHIGAFVVRLGKEKVTFLDTPGHAAFKAIRERGANVTDLVVLVVAADDGVMDQTIESINFAKAASVPIIVAINKIDKVENLQSSLKHLKQGLHAHDIVLEEDGGDTQAIQISALKNLGLVDLKEAILALAETMEIKSYYEGRVLGTVIESTIDPHRGRLATILVQSGTLKRGDVLVAGTDVISYVKVRAMFDEWGSVLQQTSPGIPVQVIGWRDDSLPEAGEKVFQVTSEKRARQIFLLSKEMQTERMNEEGSKVAMERLAKFRAEYEKALQARKEAGRRYGKLRYSVENQVVIDDPDGDKKLNIILKADVNGSLEALMDVLETYPNETQPFKVNIVHYAVGPVLETDVVLAASFPNTFIFAFNVHVPSKVANAAREKNVEIRKYNIIYRLVDSLKQEISKRLPLVDEEVVVGEALVLQEFLVSVKNKKVPVAGCTCTKGSLKRDDCFYKLVRKEKVIKDKLKILSMRHLKDEVNVVENNVECGLRLESADGETVRFENLDNLVCYKIKKVPQTTPWKPKGF